MLTFTTWSPDVSIKADQTDFVLSSSPLLTLELSSEHRSNVFDWFCTALHGQVNSCAKRSSVASWQNVRGLLSLLMLVSMPTQKQVEYVLKLDKYTC